MKRLRRFVLACAAMLLETAALAQGYPSRPVRLIVPFPAGGPSDILARPLAQGMSEFLKQPVVVENRGGAGGVLGVDAVAKSAPDGYTLAFNNCSSLAISPYSLSAIPYKVERDFALITTVASVPEVLVVSPSVPVKTLPELIAYARANPGKINFGSAGAGSITHLAGELLNVEANVKLVHVPYKGAAPAVADLLGGQVQMAILDVPVVLPHIRSGRLMALAVTSEKRAIALPELPTTVELGYPRVTSDNWYGLAAPSRTPPEVLKRVHEAAIAALRAPSLIEQYAKVSAVPAPVTPQQYTAFVRREQAKWSKIVAAIGFKE